MNESLTRSSIASTVSFAVLVESARWHNEKSPVRTLARKFPRKLVGDTYRSCLPRAGATPSLYEPDRRRPPAIAERHRRLGPVSGRGVPVEPTTQRPPCASSGFAKRSTSWFAQSTSVRDRATETGQRRIGN